MSHCFPSKPDFLKLAKKANLIPVYREVLGDLETPVSLFLKTGDKPYSYLLESVEGGEKLARYTFIGVEPSLIFKTKGRRVTISSPGRTDETYETRHDPFYELQKLLSRFRQAPVADLPPFSGGAVGYLGYDTVRFIEKIPDNNVDHYGIPDALFIFADTLYVFDHLNRKIRVIHNACLDRFKDPEEAYRHAQAKIDEAVRRIRSGHVPVPAHTPEPSTAKLKIQSNFNPETFRQAVLKAKEHIRKGDIFQVVLSQAFRTQVRSKAFDVYRMLRSINPSPYMFYLNCGGFRLVGSSPEVHVRCEDGRAQLRPIAGTRPRGKDAEQDAALEKELLADPKERAEHLMLVDLGRNDLGRVCQYRSVQVKDFMTVERYSHVMHIVSHVEGVLDKGKTVFDLLRATFPAGTISGAPKVRAMEIIDELENQKRGFYSGVVGYFSYSGNLDSCITIRTLLLKEGTAWVQAGAGIVADSDPAKEYQETVNKAGALLKAIQEAESGVWR